MFYSQFILAKKGPLGTIWIAAHLERKLRKNQVADTDIGESVDSILFPDTPIALRLSSHLLLGVVRIYSRKVNYLFDDCSEALLKVKQAFRSTAVDLPPEESTAPYHSITLPETFDLVDFELPDNDILQGNYVDHHVSAREQITLQDTMDGVVFSTSQFGLDERFGDGDASQLGLDLEEDMFLDKAATRVDEGAVGMNAEVDARVDLEKDKSNEGITRSSETMRVGSTGDQIVGLTGNSEFMEYAEAPQTPGLVEVQNFPSIEKGMAGDMHMECEDVNVKGKVIAETSEIAASQLDLHLNDQTLEDISIRNSVNDNDVCMSPDEDHDLEKRWQPAENSPPGVVPTEDIAIEGEAAAPLDLDKGGPIPNNSLSPMDQVDKEHIGSPCYSHITSELGNSGQASAIQEVHNNVKIGSGLEESYSHEKTLVADAACSLQSPSRPSVDAANLSCQHSMDPANSVGPAFHKENPSMKHVLQPCSSRSGQPDVSPTGDVVDTCLIETDRSQEALHVSEAAVDVQGEKGQITDVIQSDGNQVLGSALDCEVPSDSRQSDEQLDKSLANDNQMVILTGTAVSDLPAPEKLLSVPEGLADNTKEFLDDSTPNKEVLAADDIGSGLNHITGKKRSLTESSVTVESFESVGLTGSRRNSECVPDDDDLLSSILVGRRSSVLKLKPTPVPEVGSKKRPRTAPRSTALKRKILMDDAMVLHGDIIREQLINTEGVRRMRKKAPCTSSEILMIQRQFLDVELFREALFTGTSDELVSLQRETFDFGRIKVVKNEECRASMQTAKDGHCSIMPSVLEENEVEGTIALGAQSDIQEQPAQTPIETESHPSVGLDSQGKANSDVQGTIAIGVQSDIQEQPALTPIDTESHPSIGLDSQGKANTDVQPLHNKVLCENSDMETTKGDTEAANPVDLSAIQGFGVSSSVNVPGEACEMLAGEKTDITETSELEGSCIFKDGLPIDNISVNAISKKSDITDKSELTGLYTLNENQTDTVLVDISSGQGTGCTEFVQLGGENIATDLKTSEEFLQDNIEFGAIFDSGDIQVGRIDSICNANDSFAVAFEVGRSNDLAIINDDGAIGEVGNNQLGKVSIDDFEVLDCINDNGDPTHTGAESEKAEMGSMYPTTEFDNVTGYRSALPYSGENLLLEEVDQQSTMEVGTSSRDYMAEDPDELDNLADGNDTGFLNMNDDEISEEEDDGIEVPHGEENRTLENSGWSSRTKAVAKYLHTLFDQEAVQEKKQLPMDKLLSGKTRKEASRMFFETLVLKTRDYIHVEQATPFDNIVIKPGAKLFKSDNM